MTKKVLIVEDDLPIVQATSFKLNQEGIHTDAVFDGASAMEKVKKEKYDLVLLDLRLPGKDGFEVIKEIRADEKLKDLNILVFTNLSEETDIKRAMDLGANKYFIKSNIGVNELVEIVTNELA